MRKRLNNVSLLRMFSMISILIFHILMVYFGERPKDFFPLYFGVQIFLFISGLLYSKSNVVSAKQFYKKQFAKILIPTIIVIIVDFLLCLLLNPAAANPQNWFTPSGPNYYALGHLWFILIILSCYLLVPLLKIGITGGVNRLIVILFILLFEIVLDLFTNLTVSMVAFIVGYWLGSRNFLDHCSDKKRKALSICAICFVLSTALYVVFRNFVPRNTYAESLFASYFERFFVVPISISFAVFFLTAFEWINDLPVQPKIFVYSDKYSFSIYLCHHILMVNTASCLFLTRSIPINILITLCLTLNLAICVTKLSAIVTKTCFSESNT